MTSSCLDGSNIANGHTSVCHAGATNCMCCSSFFFFLFSLWTLAAQYLWRRAMNEPRASAFSFFLKIIIIAWEEWVTALKKDICFWFKNEFIVECHKLCCVIFEILGAKLKENPSTVFCGCILSHRWLPVKSNSLHSCHISMNQRANIWNIGQKYRRYSE